MYYVQNAQKILNKGLITLTSTPIPESHFKVRRGKSTFHAMANLLSDIKEALMLNKGKFYIILVDYKEGFDLLNKARLISKLEDMTGGYHLVRLLRNILAYNYVVIVDNISE